MRGTVAGLGVLLILRLAILCSDLERSRRNSHGAYPRRFFNDHLPLMRLTSVLVVALVVVLAVQLGFGAGRVVFWLVVLAGVGYATASFFGPTQWAPSPNSSGNDGQLDDAAGYAGLVVAEIVLAGLLATAGLSFTRRVRSAAG
ncbi:hypothetical protein ASC61_05885 [Aeromicrobium sp. Root344]|nr:hypothetical protein ASC61_05885 [Aeromicrobium sp. Root344]